MSLPDDLHSRRTASLWEARQEETGAATFIEQKVKTRSDASLASSSGDYGAAVYADSCGSGRSDYSP